MAKFAGDRCLPLPLAVSIEDHGAVPDWSGAAGTDNTRAIQSAIDTGAHRIFVPAKPFRISGSLWLGDGQQLVGEPSGLYTPSRTLPQSLLALRTGNRAVAAIRNKPKQTGQGVRNLTLELDDVTHHGVQFIGSYGALISGLTMFGKFDVAVALHDTYVSRVEDLVACGCWVRRALVYIGASNAITVRNLHSSALPADPGTCFRAIAIYGGGRNYAIENPVLQGATIGLHVRSGILAVDARNIYTENTLCSVRLGEGNEGPHAVTLQGVFGAAYATHPQFASGGPNIWYEAGNAVRIGASRFDSPPAPQSTKGPWPVLCGNGAGSLALDMQSAYGASSERELLVRQSANAAPAIEMTASSSDGGRMAIVPTAGHGNGAHAIIRAGQPARAQPEIWTVPIAGGRVSALLAQRMPTPPEILVA